MILDSLDFVQLVFLSSDIYANTLAHKHPVIRYNRSAVLGIPDNCVV